MPRPRRRRPPVIRDPLLPLGPKTIRAQISKDTLAYTNPLAAELTRSLNARAAAGARNIAGVSDELARSLMSYQGQVGGIYDRSIGQQSALNTQVADRLAAAGQGAADTLRARLAQSGGNPGLADALAKTGQGASAAGFATGAAEIGQLTSNRASGEQYASALPGIAKLSGLQGIRELQARKMQELDEGMADIRSRGLAFGAQAAGEARTREFNKAVAMRGYGLDEAKIIAGQQKVQTQQAAATRRTQIQQRNANQRAANQQAAQTERTQIQQRNANKRATERAAQTGSQVDMAQSRARGYYVDKHGRPILSKQGGRMWLPLRSRDVYKNKKAPKKDEKKTESASGLNPDG